MLSSFFFRNQIQNPLANAMAVVNGSDEYADIHGTVRFFALKQGGILVEASISGLPPAPADYPTFFAFHLHEYGNCDNPSGENFPDTGMHYNPYGTSHPHHAGDFPPLLNNNGFAWMSFYDEYLTIEDVIGRSVIIHRNRDDFTSQPSGDAGEKIACGVVAKL